jgi:hypothetical protein
MGLFASIKKLFKEEELKPKQWPTERESLDYQKFKKEEVGVKKKGFEAFFEKSAHFAGRALNLSVPKSIEERLYKSLLILDMDVTPKQVFSLAILSFILSLSFLFIPVLLFPSEYTLLLLSIPFLITYYVLTYPSFISEITKIRAADESIKVILYMVIYLRLTPNMEGAVAFAARHCGGPFGRDLKKILWDLEMGKYRNINDAFSSRVKKWIEWDRDFLEAFQGLMSLSNIVAEDRRKRTLESSLDLILDRTFIKMKEYGKNLRIPTLMLHTIGLTFPIMGLIMFPIAAIFLTNDVNPLYIAFGYTVVLPLFLFWYTRRVIAKRPGAYSYPRIEHHPQLPPEGRIALNFRGKKMLMPVWPVAMCIMLLLVAPGLAYMSGLARDYIDICGSPLAPCLNPDGWKARINLEYNSQPCTASDRACVVNPAFTSILFSVSIIWGIAFGLAFYFFGISFQRIKIRDSIKTLENEFIVGLSRLSDVLASNMPIETSIEEVAKKYKIYGYEDSPMYGFFTSVLRRMKEMGQTFEKAIFGKAYGVIKKYPSKMINDTLSVIVSASKRGPHIVSMVTKSISDFLSRSRKVEEMIGDVLDEVVSNTKLQVGFIAPFVCAIVSGTAVILIQLLHVIAKAIERVNELLNWGSGVNLLSENLLGINIKDIIPPTVFQLIIGTYMIEVVLLLSFFLNGLDNGFDKTTRNYLIGKYLFIAAVLYSIVLLASVLMFGPIVNKIIVVK